MAFSDNELYDRMLATLIASWRQIAAGSDGGSVERVPGASVAVFPAGPERAVYNNAVLDRGLDGGQAPDAVTSVAEMYAEGAVDRYAIWVHEAESASIGELVARGLEIDTWTRAMATSLDGFPMEAPQLELGPSEWGEHLSYLQAEGVPDGLLAGVDGSSFHVLVVRFSDENVATAIAYDHEGDCGIFNMGTLPAARRRGLATALTVLHANGARERGCETASLQATEMARGVYASVGFRDLGRFIEYVPATSG